MLAEAEPKPRRRRNESACGAPVARFAAWVGPFSSLQMPRVSVDYKKGLAMSGSANPSLLTGSMPTVTASPLSRKRILCQSDNAEYCPWRYRPETGCPGAMLSASDMRSSISG